MISFVGKHRTVETVIKTPGKRVSAKVVWKNNMFQARINQDLLNIDGWDDLSNVKWIYSLPTNTFHNPWYKKLYMPPDKPDKDILLMTLRFWGKYRHGMTIYGKIRDGIFYQSKHHEPSLPTVNNEP